MTKKYTEIRIGLQLKLHKNNMLAAFFNCALMKNKRSQWYNLIMGYVMIISLVSKTSITFRQNHWGKKC